MPCFAVSGFWFLVSGFWFLFLQYRFNESRIHFYRGKDERLRHALLSSAAPGTVMATSDEERPAQ
jgi:hypothetical protein